jgi:peptide/nickel transport system substrate-binding protein
MKRNRRASAAAGPLLVALLAAAPASAQKAGGILKMYTVDSPASMSILEEATVFAERPMMGVFNNLVMYDQHVKQNSLQSIVPDLAISWSWNEDGTELTFPLRQGVTWHDGKPFTAKDVVCTWDLLTGKSDEKLRVNPRKSWYRNLEAVTTNGDYEVSFHLKSEAATTSFYHGSRFWVFADLPLPCFAARHAAASNRHRPIQIRCLQAQ